MRFQQPTKGRCNGKKGKPETSTNRNTKCQGGGRALPLSHDLHISGACGSIERISASDLRRGPLHLAINHLRVIRLSATVILHRVVSDQSGSHRSLSRLLSMFPTVCSTQILRIADQSQ